MASSYFATAKALESEYSLRGLRAEELPGVGGGLSTGIGDETNDEAASGAGCGGAGASCVTMGFGACGKLAMLGGGLSRGS